MNIADFSWKKLVIVAVTMLLVFLVRPELGAEALTVVKFALIIFGVVDVTKIVFKGLKNLQA